MKQIQKINKHKIRFNRKRKGLDADGNPIPDEEV